MISTPLLSLVISFLYLCPKTRNHNGNSTRHIQQTGFKISSSAVSLHRSANIKITDRSITLIIWLQRSVVLGNLGVFVWDAIQHAPPIQTTWQSAVYPSSQQHSPNCSGLSASLRCARTSRIHRVLNPQPTGLKRSLTNSPDHTSRDTLGGPVSRLRGVRASCDTQWLLHGIRQQMLDRIGNLEVGLKHPSDVSEQAWSMEAPPSIPQDARIHNQHHGTPPEVLCPCVVDSVLHPPFVLNRSDMFWDVQRMLYQIYRRPGRHQPA